MKVTKAVMTGLTSSLSIAVIAAILNIAPAAAQQPNVGPCFSESHPFIGTFCFFLLDGIRQGPYTGRSACEAARRQHLPDTAAPIVTSTPTETPAPTESASVPDAASVVLIWGAVPGAVRCELMTWRDAETGWQPIGGNNLTGTSFTHTTVTPGTNCCYTIRSINAAGEKSV